MSNKDRYKNQQAQQQIEEKKDEVIEHASQPDGGDADGASEQRSDEVSVGDASTAADEAAIGASADNSASETAAESEAGEEGAAAPVNVETITAAILQVTRDDITARTPLESKTVVEQATSFAEVLVDNHEALSDEQKAELKAKLPEALAENLKDVVAELVKSEEIAAADKAAEAARVAAEDLAAKNATFTAAEAAKLNDDVNAMAKTLQEDQLQGEERQKALAAAPSLAQPQSIVDSPIYSGLSPVAKQVMLRLEAFIKDMAIGKPQDSVTGARHQISLYRNLLRAVTDVDQDFPILWNLILAKFKEQGEVGVFDNSHLFRFFEDMTGLSRTEQRQFRNLLNMLQVTASVKSREHALKQFSLHSAIEGLPGIAQERLLAFYGQ